MHDSKSTNLLSACSMRGRLTTIMLQDNAGNVLPETHRDNVVVVHENNRHDASVQVSGANAKKESKFVRRGRLFAKP